MGRPGVRHVSPHHNPRWRPRLPDLAPNAGRQIPNDPGAPPRGSNRGFRARRIGTATMAGTAHNLALASANHKGAGRPARKDIQRASPFFCGQPTPPGTTRATPNAPNTLGGVCDRPHTHMGGGPSLFFRDESPCREAMQASRRVTRRPLSPLASRREREGGEAWRRAVTGRATASAAAVGKRERTDDRGFNDSRPQTDSFAGPLQLDRMDPHIN